MKKMLAPLIHAAFLIPLIAIAMASIELIARVFRLLPDYIRVFEWPYIFLIIGVMFISGIPLFWLANHLMQAIERLQSPSLFDHLRQTIVFYLIIGLISFAWISSGFSGGEDDVYFLTFLGYSLLSIAVNLIFLFGRH